MIGNSSDGRWGDWQKLKNWKIEGQRASDDKWILVDSHSNETFRILELRTYKVSCEETFKAIKLTQIVLVVMS